VLTSNIRDYDFLNPLLPRVRTIFYRRQSPRDGAD
jgi:hypothetical protein